jgi:hypothetical protein
MQRSPRETPPTYWPNSLKMFDSCPQRYYLKYVRKAKGRIFDKPEMIRGNITHQVLAHAFRFFSRQRSFPASLRAEIDDRVDEADHGARGTRAAEVSLIQELVDSAIDSFDQRKSVHTVECVYQYPFRGGGSEQPFTTKAKVDLVVRLDDGEIEHIDWKTGKRGPVDNIQTIAARLAIGRTLDEPRVRSTTAFLGAGETDSRILSKDEARQTWIRIRGIARDIDANHASGAWAPVQSGLCTHCEYYGHGCHLFPTARSGVGYRREP